MAFQRSYSKVWWGSDDSQLDGKNAMNASSQHLLHPNQKTTSGGLYSYFSQQNQYRSQPPHHQALQQCQPFGGSTYHSLNLSHCKSNGSNLSRIQEVEDEFNTSKMSWEKHDSPGSLRSQDSGFSDNDEFHATRRSPKSNQSSPISLLSAQTPPTVIRRTGNSELHTSLVSASRRILFSSSTTPDNNTLRQEEDIESGQSLMAKLDSIELMTELPLARRLDLDNSNTSPSSDAVSPLKENNHRIKRRRKVQRKATSPLSQAYKYLQNPNTEPDNGGMSLEISSIAAEYNNETVYLDGVPSCSTPLPPYNNETVLLGHLSESSNTLKLDNSDVSPLHLNAKLSRNTSTPKVQKPESYFPHVFVGQTYKNILLSGHSEDVHAWLHNLRLSYDHEVMSTLQTKSITQEAFKTLQITTNIVTKFVRQLQQKAISLQSAFDNMERTLDGVQNASLHDVLSGALQLLDYVSEFTQILERRSVFFTESRLERKCYEDYLHQIRVVHKDTRYSLENQHYINADSLLEDLQVLKHIILVSVQKVYEKLIRILVISVENSRCDLMLKANINMLATLMNIDYVGLPSLTKAFVQAEAVRALLVVCLDHDLTSVRALALRALASICCSPESIAQLDICGGIEIVRDILQVDGPKHPRTYVKRSEMEKREAVSLLTQITATWHGPGHKVSGVKTCIESIVEGLTLLLACTESPQTLLLCTAALNNLSRSEITSHYSIMSHETIFKLITAVEQRDNLFNVFLYEQIAAMLCNMSLNKKCHSHLANAGIINFITHTYEAEFYKNYNSRAENDARKRCIKTILHTLTRLVQNSVLGLELLEQQKHMPVSLILQLASTQEAKHVSSSRDVSTLPHPLQPSYFRDEQLPKKLQAEIKENGKNSNMHLTRQESYV